MRKVFIRAIGQRTKWMALVSLSGPLAAFMSVNGPQTIKMELEFSLSKVEMNTRENSSLTSVKATDTTSGQIIASSRAGGARTSNMDSVCTSALSRQLLSSEYGKWANE